MISLLIGLRDGLAIDEALTQTYGFNIDGLEDAWRQAISAQPRPVAAQATAQPTPTWVPTIAPISVLPLAAQITPTVIPTSTLGDQPTPVRTAPPLWLTLVLLGACCAMLLPVGVLVIGFITRNQNRSGGDNGK